MTFTSSGVYFAARAVGGSLTLNSGDATLSMTKECTSQVTLKTITHT